MDRLFANDRVKPLPSGLVIAEINKFVDNCGCDDNHKDALFSIMLDNKGEA